MVLLHERSTTPDGKWFRHVHVRVGLKDCCARVGCWITRALSQRELTRVPVKLQAAALKMLLEQFSIEQIELRVSGWSMWPCIWPGERISVVQVKPASLKVGDIVVFKRCSAIIIHRIVKVGIFGGQEMLQTQGDNVAWRDPPIARDQVLCCVASDIPPRFTSALRNRLKLEEGSGEQ